MLGRLHPATGFRRKSRPCSEEDLATRTTIYCHRPPCLAGMQDPTCSRLATIANPSAIPLRTFVSKQEYVTMRSNLILLFGIEYGYHLFLCNILFQMILRSILL